MILENLQNALAQLAPQIDTAIQQEILNEGHYKTGALSKSVNTVLVQNDDSFQLQTSMFDYWVFLNARSGFRDTAINRLQDTVTTAISEAVTSDLNISFSQILHP